MKIRLLFVCYEYPPLGGGVGTAAFHLLRELGNNDRLLVDVITSSLSNRWEREQITDNVCLYRVPIGWKDKSKLSTQTPLNMVLFSLASCWKIFQLGLKHKYDLAHYFGYPGAWPGLLFRWKMPYGISLRGVDVPGYNRRFSIFYRVYSPITRLVWGGGKFVVANSKWLVGLAQLVSPGLKIRVIANGVDASMFAPLDDSDKYREFTVTAGGSLINNKKGHSVLVSGFAEHLKNHPESKLILFGNGPELKALKFQVKSLEILDKVQFRGRVGREVLATELAKCHAYCLPSVAEGMSNATLEAAACGLPMILTRVGANEELVGKDKTAGYLIDSGDYLVVADSLDKLAASDELRLEMGKSARDRALEYSWESTAEEYLKLYDKVI